MSAKKSESVDFVMPTERHGAADARPGRPPLRARFTTALNAARRGYLQVFGIPDYERYLAHMASKHPGEPVLSRREFCARAIDRKYKRNGPRCC
jgi:uncharacterized short protein YbdD (DUF466 family)